MTRYLIASTALFTLLNSAAAEDVPEELGPPPRLVIASGIDAHGNLIVSGTEQRKKTVPREVERDGKKVTQESTVNFPVTVLGRQSVALKDVTIYDGEDREVSMEEARHRLKQPTPVLLTMMGEKLDPVYRKMLTKETLTFVFKLFPEMKDLGKGHAAHAHEHKDAIAVGDKVPDLALKTVDGKTVKLSEMRADEKRAKHGVVVLSFWCSTCTSCRRVEQDLAKLTKQYEGQAAVFALDANAGETAAGVAAFAREQGLTLPIVLDATGRSADIFGTEKTTTTVVIDGHGVLRYCGRFRQAEEALKEVLAGKEVAVKTTPHDG
jgi:peroxiredoxin